MPVFYSPPIQKPFQPLTSRPGQAAPFVAAITATSDVSIFSPTAFATSFVVAFLTGPAGSSSLNSRAPINSYYFG